MPILAGDKHCWVIKENITLFGETQRTIQKSTYIQGNQQNSNKSYWNYILKKYLLSCLIHTNYKLWTVSPWFIFLSLQVVICLSNVFHITIRGRRFTRFLLLFQDDPALKTSVQVSAFFLFSFIQICCG